MFRKKGWFLFLVFAVCATAFWTAAPVRAESGAMAQVKSVLDRAMEIQTDPALQGTEHRKERSVLVRKLIADSFLSSEMARDSVKDHWDKLSPRQRDQYRELFTGLFQDSYTRMVLNFLRQETVEYPGETPEGKQMKVRTIIMRTNEHIPVDYLLEQNSGRWFIRDVIIDEVSIVENYRNTFGRVIRTQSFDALLQKMRIQKKAGEDV